MATERVLVVDDYGMNLELAEALLESEGYVVRTASSAGEALEAIAGGFQPEVILVDIQMPWMDGLELSRRLRSNPALRRVIIIALTSYTSVGDEEQILAAGCDGYIPKPIDTRSFRPLLREALAQRGPH